MSIFVINPASEVVDEDEDKDRILSNFIPAENEGPVSEPPRTLLVLH